MPDGNGSWLSEGPEVARYARHVNSAFVRLLGVYGYGRLFVRARDVWLWDSRERQYLDFLAGFGAVNLGHNHPRLRQRLHAFLDEEALNLCHVGPSKHAADLAEALARLAAPLEVCLFSSSGAEAVEAGLKLARAVTRRAGFLYCRGGFHGTNLGSLSVMGSTRLRKPFEPLLADCTAVPFGDLDRLARELAGRRHAALVVEPILGEGGVVPAPAGYLAGARELCRRHGALLVLDEVQTGLGRTGSLFAYQAEGVTPDVLVLGKSLGGSLAAISATLTTRELHQRAYGSMGRFDLHGSTFGGNALACVAALETLRIIEDEQLTLRSKERGEQLLSGLRQRLAGHPLVREVRGAGLLVGIELGATDDLLGRVAPWLVDQVARGVLGQWLALRLLEAGILAQPASQCWNVLRLEPPLTVQREHVEQVVDTLGNILDEYRGLGRLLQDVGARLGRQMLNGWRW
jgi:putrescine aminotransferase